MSGTQGGEHKVKVNFNIFMSSLKGEGKVVPVYTTP
jgi:hypothetical protein